MIQISLRQLEYFLAAARHGGAARAAEALHVSEPSISKAVADLEALWGEALFVRRHAKGMDLTAAGVARQKQAQALMEGALRMQGPRGTSMTGILRIGYLSTLGPRWVPSILTQLRQAHPGIEVELIDGDTETLTSKLERGELDVALQYDLGLARPRLTHVKVAELVPYALLPWGHELASKTSVKLEDLARWPLVLINLPHSREYFLSLFREAGVMPQIAYETQSFEMVRSLVANHHGIAMLTTRPVMDRAHDGKRLVCKRLRGTIARQPVVLMYPKGTASALVAPLIPVVRSVFASAKVL